MIVNRLIKIKEKISSGEHGIGDVTRTHVTEIASVWMINRDFAKYQRLIRISTKNRRLIAIKSSIFA
jgi:hypothetical protein